MMYAKSLELIAVAAVIVGVFSSGYSYCNYRHRALDAEGQLAANRRGNEAGAQHVANTEAINIRSSDYMRRYAVLLAAGAVDCTPPGQLQSLINSSGGYSTIADAKVSAHSKARRPSHPIRSGASPTLQDMR